MTEESEFTHVREGLPAMVDITAKGTTRRSAVAAVRVELGTEIAGKLEGNEIS